MRGICSEVFSKKGFLKISQNSQESTCARVPFLIKLQAPPASLLKKRLRYRCFPLNFAMFLGALENIIMGIQFYKEIKITRTIHDKRKPKM